MIIKKIVFQILAIICFLLGVLIIHVSINSDARFDTLIIFGMNINKNFIIDIGFLLIIVSFSIEFYLSFKPIKIEVK